ncbi:MAG: PaaI family thioesterase [Rhodobacterales bacterium]|tara:strand:- start:5947 stop:6438 length:492 start_codon:yes stop_codon:yes gene_type:complete
MKKLNENPIYLPSNEVILSMSGLEFMKKIENGELPVAPISHTLNYELNHVSLGRVIFRGSPRFNAMNPIGSVHGGWYGTLLDSAMACAIMTKVPKGSVYTTLEYKINIIKPIPIDMQIDAIGEVSHAGRSTGTAEGRIIGTKNKTLYATGSTTCIIIPLVSTK